MTPLATARTELAAAEAAYLAERNARTELQLSEANLAVSRALEPELSLTTRVRGRPRKVLYYVHEDAARARHADVDADRRPNIRQITRGQHKALWEVAFWMEGGWTR